MISLILITTLITFMTACSETTSNTSEVATVVPIKPVPVAMELPTMIPVQPTSTAKPTATATAEPTSTSTAQPISTPTEKPTSTSTTTPLATPTLTPEPTPTDIPTLSPTPEPTATPTPVPPPFTGTVWIPGTTEILNTSDPSFFGSLKKIPDAPRVMFDRRTGTFDTVNPFLFEADFADGLKIEVQVNSEFEPPDSAEAAALTYLHAVGQLPTLLRTEVETIWLHKGDEDFGGGNNNLLIHHERGLTYIDQGVLEEVFLHEASHTSLDPHHYGEEWKRARSADANSISIYSRDNPDREDIAETFPMYYALRYKASRVSSDLLRTIENTVPNRINYFDQFFSEMEPAPYPVRIRAQKFSKDNPNVKRLIDLGWNKPVSDPATFEVASDLKGEFTEVCNLHPECISATKRKFGSVENTPFREKDSLTIVKHGVQAAEEYLGSYGPFRVFIIGTDIQAADDMAKQFCDWAYDSSMRSYCHEKDQGVEIREIAEYGGNNGFAQHSRELSAPNQSFVIGNPFRWGYSENASKTAAHEYFHIYQNAHQLLQTEDDIGLPLWLEEGSAEFLALYITDKNQWVDDGGSKINFRNRMNGALQGAKDLRKANPGLTIRDIETSELRDMVTCDGCQYYLQYATGQWATAWLINMTSLDHFYKVYIPSISEYGGEKAFENSFELTIDEFYAEFEAFMNLATETQMSILQEP